jgi:RNA polymerase sigma-70 factor, ECF subfamily
MHGATTLPLATLVMTEVRDDRRVAAACAAGDSSIFEQVYREHAALMKSIAYNHLGNTSDAEDAVQETFIKIHKAAGTFTGEASFRTWAFRILINTCYDMLRKRKRRIDEAPIDDSPAAAMRADAQVDVTKRLMLRKLLSEQRRTVFTLFEIDGLSHAEIGEILGITEGNSKWILFSTKKELQQQWKHS